MPQNIRYVEKDFRLESIFFLTQKKKTVFIILLNIYSHQCRFTCKERRISHYIFNFTKPIFQGRKKNFYYDFPFFGQRAQRLSSRAIPNLGFQTINEKKVFIPHFAWEVDKNVASEFDSTKKRKSILIFYFILNSLQE